MAPPEWEACAGASRIFPLGFTGQPIGSFRCLGEPTQEELGIVPTDVDDWTAAASPTMIIGPVLASSRRETTVPLLERHFAAPDRKGTGDDHFVFGLFIDGLARAHAEFPCRHHDHLGTVVAIAKNLAGIENGGGRRR